MAIYVFKKKLLRVFTTIGALLGFIGTRFLEDGNLLVTNAVVLITALAFRTIARIWLWILKEVKS
jgi:hypothetical protein